MGFAKARFKLMGGRASMEGIAVVDAGSLMSVVDRSAAETLGLTPTGRTVKLTTLSGEEVLCNEVVVKVFELEDERLVSERVAVCELPDNVKGKLKAMGADPRLIIGVVTLEAAGFTVNPLTGKLEKVGWLAL